MKAAVYSEYGEVDVISIKELDTPTPKDNEVLVKIHATSVNASDWEILRGKPLYARIYGLRKPRFAVLGSDIAGEVVAVGKKVRGFKDGDAVFGDVFESFGGFAEFACVPQQMLLHKPDFISFEQACALPQAAAIAIQCIRDKGQVKSGDKVLIIGAGGGSGSFAIQIAKYFGAHVTGVDNGEKQDTMGALGADRVVDYTREDFTQSAERYDLILDLAAHRSLWQCRRVLKPAGKYYMVGGAMKQVLQLLTLGTVVSLFSKQSIRMLALKSNQGLDFVLQLIESGHIQIPLDRSFPLSDTAAAINHLGQGHVKGKVVITV
ncbi:MAG: NAD(P)-dependent alcohol dehydrogenase [Gammaproteobacteria bacterium]|nr:NAD(P)-dependent alcohol dehydrogenase [Gammaproteobacteria bacterium]MDH5803113.1 NAD(P)-dependent alcohol dehydrogenase [Gammaproteobacteria bacterium]